MDSLLNIVSFSLQGEGMDVAAPNRRTGILKGALKEFTVTVLFSGIDGIAYGLALLVELVSVLWNCRFGSNANTPEVTAAPSPIVNATNVSAASAPVIEQNADEKAEMKAFHSLLKIGIDFGNSKISVDENGHLIIISKDTSLSEEQLTKTANRLKKLSSDNHDFLNALSAEELRAAQGNLGMLETMMVTEALQRSIDPANIKGPCEDAINNLTVILDNLSKRPIQNALKEVFKWMGATEVIFTDEGAQLSFDHGKTGHLGHVANWLSDNPDGICRYHAILNGASIKISNKATIDYKKGEIIWQVEGAKAYQVYVLRKIVLNADGTFLLQGSKVTADPNDPPKSLAVSAMFLKHVSQTIVWDPKSAEEKLIDESRATGTESPQVLLKDELEEKSTSLSVPSKSSVVEQDPPLVQEALSLQGRASLIAQNSHYIASTVIAVGLCCSAYLLGI